MDRRRAYESEVLSTFARLGRRAPGISNAERDHEYLAQRVFFTALASFKGEVEKAQALSFLRKDALAEFLAILADTAPDAEAWDEALSDVVRGY